MTAPIFSGALKPKKKADLQDIANALALSVGGTKDELEQRIRDHLETHELELQDNASFSGLYPRQRKHRTLPSPDDDEEPKYTPPPVSRKVIPKRVKEQTPALDSPAHIPLPPSPVRSLLNEAVAVVSKPEVAVQRVRATELARGAEQLLDNVRTFVSNSYNIATITALAEIAFIVYSVVPWATLSLPLAPPFNTRPPGGISPAILHIPYAPLDFLLKSTLYAALFQWALYALLVPQLAGTLVSFSRPRKTVDPLSAGIVRVALQVANYGSPVVSQPWRILSAAVACAFAYAEAVERRHVSPGA